MRIWDSKIVAIANGRMMVSGVYLKTVQGIVITKSVFIEMTGFANAGSDNLMIPALARV